MRNVETILLDTLSIDVFVNNYNGLQRFFELNINVLNKNASRTKNYAQGNEMPFLTRKLDQDFPVTT